MSNGSTGGLPPRTRAQVVPVLAVYPLLVLRLGLSAVSVPAWQNPDEPQHVLGVYSAGVSRALPGGLAEAERQIVASMAAWDWWPLNGAPTPDPVPATFLEGPNLVRGSMGVPGGGGAYYRGLAWTARILGVDSAVGLMYLARCVSALLGILTQLLVWTTARSALGTSSAVGIAGLLALHPQLCLVWSTASPDALIVFCGTVTFWASLRVGELRHPAAAVIAILMAAALAGASRRLGLVVLPMAGAALVFGSLERLRAGHTTPSRVAAGGVTLAACLAGCAWFAQPVIDRVVAEARPLLIYDTIYPDFWPFARGLHQSAWLTAGWLTFSPPAQWFVASAMLVGWSVVGVATAFLARESPGVRPVIAIASAFVAIDFAAIYFGYYRNGFAAQGRYLFPAAAAFFHLLWLGATALVPPMARQAVGTAIVAGMALFDAVAWGQVIWPAFSS
jgi:hypothetical protein